MGKYKILRKIEITIWGFVSENRKKGLVALRYRLSADVLGRPPISPASFTSWSV